jgi:hypothetical protein
MRRSPAVLLAAALVLAACGDGDGGVDGVATDPTATSEVATSGDDTITTDETSTSTEPDDDTTTSADGGGPTLPGEVVDIFPYEGAELAVVAVAADDTLNVRRGPGVGFEIVRDLPPLADGFVATGANRRIDDGAIWAEVDVDGTTGWVNSAFVAHPGQVTDITGELEPLPRAATMLELGEAVADRRTGTEGPEPTVTVVSGPTVGDLGEVVVDVTGLADDSIGGERLHVFARPGTDGGEFVVRSVEATVLCSRGVADGLCL